MASKIEEYCSISAVLDNIHQYILTYLNYRHYFNLQDARVDYQEMNREFSSLSQSTKLPPD